MHYSGRLVTSLLGLEALLTNSFVAAVPLQAQHAVVKRQEDLLPEYDFIVVGAGTAGLTVADRLSEHEDYTVLVVEYGYLDNSPAIINTGPPPTTGNPAPNLPAGTRFYNITSEPLTGLDKGGYSVAAGSVVGGSSAVNGMFFDRGSAEDYDSWVTAAGEYSDEYAKEWGWENLLPWFKKSVTFHPPTEEMQEKFHITSDEEAAYGGTTPIHSSYAPFQWPAQQAQWDAFKAIEGIDFPVEGADGHATGVFWCPSSMKPKERTRSYAKIGHYDEGAKGRENFHLLPAHRVTQVILEESESGGVAATGVIITPRDGDWPEDGPEKPVTAKAKREVIVSAGSVHTPQVLQRSGIGPKDVLEDAGVEVKVELPGVGWNLQDHSHYSVGFRWNTPVLPDDTTLAKNATFAAEALKEWQTNQTGPLSAYVNSGAFLPLTVVSNRTDELVAEFLAQDPAEQLPENVPATVLEGYKTQVQVLSKLLKSRGTAVVEVPFSGRPSFSVILIKPLSRGQIRLSPNDDGVSATGRGNVEPVVDWRSYTNPLDLELTVDFLKWMRWFGASPAMVETFDPVETNPGPAVDDDEGIKTWLKRGLSPSNGHPVGTASLGPVELGGVVGPDLRVHGVEGLSVADNSIMTIIPGTHTSSTAYAIGEKAADLVLRRAKE